MKRPKAEYGGYLPLELNPGSEYFEGYSEKLLRFNSVKAAFDHILRRTKPDKVFVPLYYCPSTTEALLRSGIPVRYYHVQENLLPEQLPDDPGTLVLLVNYFGVIDDAIKATAHSFQNATVILDQAHGFFCPPIMSGGVFNVYSARKFFGVPDGAYAIGECIYGEQPEEHLAGPTAYYLMKSYEQGTNAAYEEKKQADADIAAEYASMSRLAIGLLKNVDYDRVQTRRLQNFAAFHAALASRNGLAFSGSVPAYVYPFLCENGKALKARLVSGRIYVSTLWTSELLSQSGNAFEHSMSDNAVFLPIDQRYGDDDIAFMIHVLEDCLG